MTPIKSRPSILEVNYFYFFIAILLLFVGSIAQRWDIYKGLIITEYLLILLPTILYIKIKGYSLKKVLRLNSLTLKQTIIIPFIALFAYPVGIFLNYIGVIILTVFGKVRPSPVPIPESGGEFAIGLIIIALSAGICEEVMFRGLVFNSYEKIGAKKAIIISGLLFGFFHFNLQNLIGPIFLGMLFGYILYKTNSIYSTMIAHAFNNGIALTIGFAATKLLKNVDIDMASKEVEGLENVTKSGEILGLLISAVVLASVAIVCGVIVYLLIKALPSSNDTSIDSFRSNSTSDISRGRVVLASIPIAIVGLIFIYQGYLFITL